MQKLHNHLLTSLKKPKTIRSLKILKDKLNNINKVSFHDITKGLLFIASLALLYYCCAFILMGVGFVFVLVADFIDNPLIIIILSVLLLVILAIAIGVGKANGETFGGHKARNLFKDLKKETGKNNKEQKS